MKKIIIGFAWMLLPWMVQSAEVDRNRSEMYARQSENNAQDLQTYSEILTELQSTKNQVNSCLNCMQELQMNSSFLYEEVQNAYADVYHYRPHIIQDFMNNPETECFNKNSYLPAHVKQIAFELVRARAGLTRNPYSQDWQYVVADNEKKILNSMCSGGINFLAADIANQNAFWALAHKRRTVYFALQVILHDYNELQKNYELLLQKRDAREQFLEDSWYRIAHTVLAQHEKNKAACIIQCAVKKLLHNSRLHKQTAITTNLVIDTTIQEMIQELVDEQIESMKLQEIKRAERVVQHASHKSYERKLTKITDQVVHDVVTTVVTELKNEQDLERKTREQAKIQLKKIRKKEAENKKKSAQLEEERLLAESIAQNAAQAAVLNRMNHEACLKHSGSIHENNLKAAMLVYDFAHLNLFDECDNILNDECVVDFMILFTTLLSLPFIDTVSLWPDVVKNVKKIHEQLQGKNKFLHMYVIDKNKLTSLLFEKEKEILALRTKILSENPKEMANKLREERLKIQSNIEEFKIRSQAVGIPERLQREFIKKINELNKKTTLIYEHEQSYKIKCHQIVIINEIRSLQDPQGPFPLFEKPLPVIIDVGYLNEQELQEVHKILHNELHYWLSYEDVITQEDIERSLFKVLEKLSIDRADHDRFAKHLAHDVLKFERLHYTPSENLLQNYFEHFCRINKIHGDDFDINISADVAKIQNILLGCLIEYQKHRAV